MTTGRKTAVLAALALLLLLVATGCGANAGANEHEGHEGHAEGHGSSLPDNIETTAAPSVLPAFLDDYTDITKSLYAQAPDHADLLQQLDCYCGCMEYNDPHDSLYRCFIVGVDEDGVHWTNHGGSCGVCLMELRDAIQMANDGNTIDEIKQHIDSTYGGL